MTPYSLVKKKQHTVIYYFMKVVEIKPRERLKSISQNITNITVCNERELAAAWERDKRFTVIAFSKTHLTKMSLN